MMSAMPSEPDRILGAASLDGAHPGDQAPMLKTLSGTLIGVRWPWNGQRIRSVVGAERRLVHLR